ncbi:Ankrd17 [Symbiodinium natans]|uniref:Ankrd17 protein n=1 Tax=Symbiodinium natans TaxID=878477 RepID=A0A812TV43_9DINO|nr:Ankrd17 [Symbiodinium natans]
MGMGASVRREQKPSAVQDPTSDESQASHGRADAGTQAPGAEADAASPQQLKAAPEPEGPAGPPAGSLAGPPAGPPAGPSARPSAGPAGLEVVQAAKLSPGAEPIAAGGSSSSAALVQAVEAEDWAAAEQLLNERPGDCDVNARTTDWNYSLLRACAEEGAEGLCQLLLARQADVNARDQNNMTPLMGCVVGGDYSGIVSLLLEARADAAAITDDGFTALKWATRLNRDASITLLRNAGMTGEASAFA